MALYILGKASQTMKHCFPILLFLGFCLTFCTGCGGSRKDAASSVKAIYDLYILGEAGGISSLGMGKEDIAAARQAYDHSLKDTIRSNFAASGQDIDEDTLDELCAARKAALSKMTASAEVTKEGKGKATVVIHTTYFDESALDANAFYAASEAAQQNSFADPEEQQTFLMDAYTQNLIDAYHDVTPSRDTTDIIVECVIQNNNWVPANMSSFGSELALAIAGQN